jgi:citrate lyase beta subunit
MRYRSCAAAAAPPRNRHHKDRSTPQRTRRPSRGNAALLDGKMVDRPVLMKAQAIIGEAAARRGGHAPDS